mmetsp:Transcript_147169/g.470304  ORF Transcript_147169/g.470304 Transcript_147169/m.470304 type:complete len:201 (+) Transcript_147169:922-1524(+)
MLLVLHCSGIVLQLVGGCHTGHVRPEAVATIRPRAPEIGRGCVERDGFHPQRHPESGRVPAIRSTPAGHCEQRRHQVCQRDLRRHGPRQDQLVVLRARPRAPAPAPQGSVEGAEELESTVRSAAGSVVYRSHLCVDIGLRPHAIGSTLCDIGRLVRGGSGSFRSQSNPFSHFAFGPWRDSVPGSHVRLYDACSGTSQAKM